METCRFLSVILGNVHCRKSERLLVRVQAQVIGGLMICIVRQVVVSQFCSANVDTPLRIYHGKRLLVRAEVKPVGSFIVCIVS